MTRPLIVAEISCAHGGKATAAMDLIKEASAAGADAVKFQCFDKQLMAMADYKIEAGPWKGHKAREFYASIWTPWEWLPDLQQAANSVGLEFFVSVFDLRALEYCEAMLNCRRYKVASFEITDTQLIDEIARTRKQIIISTGMALQNEIDEAVGVVSKLGWLANLTLLKCTSAYPATLEDVNLSTMQDMKKRWRCDVGVSDHTPGSTVPVAATVLGASIIEKHLRLPNVSTPDDGFAMLPDKFGDMVIAVSSASYVWGAPSYGSTKAEQDHVPLRRCLHWARDIGVGETIKRADLIPSRGPGGIPVRSAHRMVGRAATAAAKKGEPVRWRDVASQAEAAGKQSQATASRP